VEEWRQRKIPAFEASLAHAGQAGVAIARRARAGAAPGGLGIGITVLPDDRPQATPPAGLSGQELAVLEAAATASGTGLGAWTARALAAKEAVASAEGGLPPGAAGQPAVTAAGHAVITVAVADRVYRVSHRDIRNPDDMPARRYAVAWTRGPEEIAPTRRTRA
jgi:hypothetical protein